MAPLVLRPLDRNEAERWPAEAKAVPRVLSRREDAVTTFVDGPAKGQTLMLKRSPEVLNVVFDTKTGKWDALDQPGDKPSDSEVVHVYVLCERCGTVHVNCRGGGGFFPIAKYKLAVRWTQPEEQNQVIHAMDRTTP